jgi:hypothetical protein
LRRFRLVKMRRNTVIVRNRTENSQKATVHFDNL